MCCVCVFVVCGASPQACPSPDCPSPAPLPAAVPEPRGGGGRPATPPAGHPAAAEPQRGPLLPAAGAGAGRGQLRRLGPAERGGGGGGAAPHGQARAMQSLVAHIWDGPMSMAVCRFTNCHFPFLISSSSNHLLFPAYVTACSVFSNVSSIPCASAFPF